MPSQWNSCEDGVLRITEEEDDSCDNVTSIAYTFANGTLTVDGEIASEDECDDYGLTETCTLTIDATIDAQGELHGTLSLHCTGTEFDGGPFEEYPVDPFPLIGVRRPIAGTSGNSVLGAWSVTQEGTETGDTASGTFEGACEGTDGAGVSFSATEVGTITATRFTVEDTTGGEGEGEGPPPPIQFNCSAGIFNSNAPGVPRADSAATPS